MAVTNIPEKKRGGIQPFHIWLLSLGVMLVVGGWGIYQTLWHGLQVTNLSDRVPWGLWITHDLSAIALGAGAFTLSAVVYLFRIKRFEPMARIAVFVGFLGYTSAMLALAMDIGRPDRFWHPLVYWNVHSVLWEITLCVILYSTVLVIEVLPIIFDSRLFDNRPKWRRIRPQIAQTHARHGCDGAGALDAAPVVAGGYLRRFVGAGHLVQTFHAGDVHFVGGGGRRLGDVVGHHDH